MSVIRQPRRKLLTIAHFTKFVCPFVACCYITAYYVCIATHVRDTSAKKKVTDHTSEKGKYVNILNVWNTTAIINYFECPVLLLIITRIQEEKDYWISLKAITVVTAIAVWSVTLWRDSDDVPHCRILSADKTERHLISATICGWRHCFMVDQLWFMTRIREEEEESGTIVFTLW